MSQLPEEDVYVFPISFSQQRLWFLDRLEPDSAFYNIFLSVRIKDALYITTLEASLQEIVRRHEILRTTFATIDNQPIQMIGPEIAINLKLVDFSDLSESDITTMAQQLVVDESHRPFDLSQGPLIRGLLFKLYADEYIFLLNMHHIVSDEWSIEILLRELKQLYETYSNGEPSTLEELPIQYADYAIWQREQLEDEILDNQLSYWKDKLSNLELLNIPTDRMRPAVQSYNGSHQSLRLSEGLSDKLKKLSHNQGCTLFMTLLAAFKILLNRYTHQVDIAMGTPIANRTRAEVENLIGFFVNTLVMRTVLSGDLTFCELLSQVREISLEAYAHQDLPFEMLVEQLQPKRDMSRSPLFQVMFVLQNAPQQSLELPGLTISPFEADSWKISKFDLTLFIWEQSGVLNAGFEYNTDLFDDTTIARMLEHLHVLLEGIVTNPSQHISELPLLTEAEQHQLLVEWNDTKVDYPKDKCIHQLFEEQVEKTPYATALVFEDQQLTYRELDTRANQLAHHLQKLGVGPDVLVGICVERSLEMIVGLLGILKAGGAYVPLDPAYPKKRLAFMLEDTQASVLLTQESLLENLPEHKAHVICLDRDWEAITQNSKYNPINEVLPENLAYVIYTSGSTGKPKGVLVDMKSLVNLCQWYGFFCPIEPHSSAILVIPLSFDAATKNIFTPLICGGELVLFTNGPFDPKKLLRMIEKHQIKVMNCVPSVFYPVVGLAVKNDYKQLYSLKCLAVGGEAIRLTKLKSWILTQDCQYVLANIYGPTECTDISACYKLPRKKVKNTAHVPIGGPISNTKIYLVGHNIDLVPPRSHGEVVVAGKSLARGYLNRPELTGEKFLPDPLSDEAGSRLYKTGDLARYLPDGNIEFLGRIDNQVKIRGFRIELDEVGAAISRHEVIRECVATISDDEQGDKKLVAFVVCDESISSLSLRRFLREILPDYMIPSQFVQLDAIPFTPNGKVDYKLLQSLTAEYVIQGTTYIPPATSVEKQIAEIWKDALGVDKVGLNDNFFDLGGHSLLLTKAASIIEEKLSVQMPLKEFFNQTLGQLAASCEEKMLKNEINYVDKST